MAILRTHIPPPSPPVTYSLVDLSYDDMLVLSVALTEYVAAHSGVFRPELISRAKDMRDQVRAARYG